MTELFSEARLPTEYGEHNIYVFREGVLEHTVLVKPNGIEPTLVRIHSKCLTGEVFGSLKCDCGEQLQIARERIGEEGGMLIYLDQEGRGIGLGNKMKIYALQEQGLDTVDSMLALGFEEDLRDFNPAVDILEHFGVKSVRLLTNNPKKISALTKRGIEVKPVEIKGTVNLHNASYLLTKEERMGHTLGMRKEYGDFLKRMEKRNKRGRVKPVIRSHSR